jgi:peptide deformylase
MAVLEIRKYPDRILREKTSPVNDFGPSLQRLIDDMIETMYAAPGVGLAANQVGVPKQVMVVDVSTKQQDAPLIVIINPQIVLAEGESASEEGCLSLPDYTTVVKRAERVKVRGLDRHGREIEVEGEGLLARALQHEIDHLNGKLLIDRISRLKREWFKKRYLRQTQQREVVKS